MKQHLWLRLGVMFGVLALVSPMPASGQPQVTYDPGAAVAAGLPVTFGNDAHFTEALNPFLQHPNAHVGDITPLRPYGVVLTNASPKPVAMFSVIYEHTHANGQSSVGTVAVNARDSTGIPKFIQGRSVLILPGISVVGPISVISQSTIDGQAKMLADVTAAKVLVDAIIFEDGSLYGPDQHGLATRYDAESRALRDVLQEIGKTGAATDVFSQYLQALVATEPSPLASVREPLRDAAYYYQRMRQQVGRSLQRLGDPGKGRAWLAEVTGRYGQLHRP